MDPGAFTATIIMLVVIALVFDFMNGFHDAANSIATVVSTGVLKPYQAVMWAAFFNFVAIMLFELKVAATVGKGIVDPAFVDNHVIFGALIGAIAWNVITWYYGLPSSSSHALIGGMIGATVAKAGTGPLLAPGIIKTVSFIVVAPLLGMLLSGIIIVAVSWICRRRTQRQTDRWFRKLQLVSSAMYSIGHGGNDAQKTMGIIWLLLMTANLATPQHLPVWVVVSLLCRNRARHAVRRLAHRQDHGPAHHQAEAGRRLRGRDRRRDLAVPRDQPRHPGLDHAHDHGLDHRRRQRAARARRALGRRRQHRGGLGRDHPRLGADRRRRLVGRLAALLGRLAAPARSGARPR